MKSHHSPGKRFGQKCVTFLTSLVKSHKSPFSVIMRKKNMFFQQHTIQGLGALVLNTPLSKGILLLRHAEIAVSGVLGGGGGGLGLVWVGFFLEDKKGSELRVKHAFLTETDPMILIRRQGRVSSSEQEIRTLGV